MPKVLPESGKGPASSVPAMPEVSFELDETLVPDSEVLASVSLMEPLLCYRPVRDVIIQGEDTALRRIEHIARRRFAQGLRVQKYLGHGTYGAAYQVCLSRKIVVGAPVIEKTRDCVLKIFFDRIEEAVQYIKIEAELPSSIKYPGIVRFYTRQPSEGWMLMALEGKMTLAEASRKRLLNTSQLKVVTTQLCYILRHLTRHRIAHWDFKPENIALDNSGRFAGVTLINFGLSERVPSHMLFGRPRGTVCFRAPEMYTAFFGATYRGYDAFKPHWFALGAKLYEAAFGVYPFENEKYSPEEKAWIKTSKDKWVAKGLQEDLLHYLCSTYQSIRAPAGRKGDLDLLNFIQGLMEPDPERRLGFEQIREHPWMRQVNWPEFDRFYEKFSASHS
jgi:serine/threonine protein kinase